MRAESARAWTVGRRAVLALATLLGIVPSARAYITLAMAEAADYELSRPEVYVAPPAHLEPLRPEIAPSPRPHFEAAHPELESAPSADFELSRLDVED